MTTYNTGNPVGSVDPKDLYDNAQNLDNIVNGSEHSYADRLGVARRSLAGIDAAADAVLSGLGYAPPVTYAAGISLTLTTQTVEYNGEVYAPKLSALPFTTGGTFDPAKFRVIQGVLASDLAATGGAALVGADDGASGSLWTTVAGFISFLLSSLGASVIGFIQAGTGAVAGTVQDELRQVVKVTQFGASPTKTAAQNAACVQAAINSLVAGGEVVFPNGDWPMDTVYVQNDRVSIRGEGDATIILPGNSDGIVVGMSAASLSFCDVRNLRFDRATKSTSGAAVKMVNTVYSAVENCKFRNSYIGVHVKTHNDSLRVERNTFYDGTYYGVYENNQNETWANDLTIRGNFFWHVEQAGVYMTADGVGVASVGDTYIDDNVFVSSISKGALQTQYAIRVVGAGSYNTNISVSRNTFEGIRLQTVFMTGLNRCRIADNYFSGTDTNDVGLYFGSGVGNSIISGNVFIGYNNPGAFVFSTNGITLTGNHFAANATLGGANAELKMLNVQDAQVSGNYFYSSSSRYCIDIEQSGATVDNLTITGNRFTKFSGNTNYVYDIRHHNYGGAKLMRGNTGNDATSGAATAAPVAGMALQWYAGDKIENKNAVEAGTAGSKYVVIGWVCVAQGDPGTWREQRVLTGL